MDKKLMLIVDDEEINIGLLTAIFEDEYTVKTAADGLTALSILGYYGSKISVVLLDLVMPGMDGFAVLAKMQDQPELRSIPVIVVSGQDEKEAGLKAIKYGAADYVTKPVDPDWIAIKVEATISKRENARLRTENDYFLLQSSEQAKYQTVLMSTGTVVVEFDRQEGKFKYDPSISRHIAGTFDQRRLWQIFMSDMVADVRDVKAMQELVYAISTERDKTSGSITVKLMTPAGSKQWFRMQVFMQPDSTSKMILIFNNVNDEVESAEKLRFQAERDVLTGLYNRTMFFEKAAEMIAAHEPGHYVMACFDIDKFKVINDQHGDAKGDEVLRDVARVAKEGFSAIGGICSRIMADDFAALYPSSYMGSEAVTEILRRASVLDGELQPLSFSVGRYIVDDLTLPVSGMYDRAILAQAAVKDSFEHNIGVYDEAMREQLLREQQVTSEMKNALETEQFEVWFQPQYNHATGALIGAEALVRWRHPQAGLLIPPGEFIPVFERNGFIYEMDKYIWKESCLLLRRWLDEGLPPLPVSINISRYDMLQGDVVGTLTGLIEKYTLPVDILRVEITESAFSENTDHIIRITKELIQRGFTVEIDDFGSGYSSLNTLKDVPAQVLKLDMRFLENSEDSGRGGNVLESVVRMAKWLGMAVIAEGVETIEQADFLKSIGCVYVQGYLYGKPMPADEYEALLRNSSREEQLLALRTVKNLDKNTFWDPKSMDTLIFNSYVGAACIVEYSDHRVELLRASDMFWEMLGSRSMTVEEALTLDWRSHFSAASQAAWIEAVQRSISDGVSVSGEYLLLDLPGCPPKTYLRISLRVIANTGNSNIVYCLGENITAQKEAEEKERVSAAQLQAILSALNSGVSGVTTGDDGKVRYVFANDLFYSMLGYTKEQFEIKGSDVMELIHPDDKPRIDAELAQLMQDGGSTVFEYRVIRLDGEIIHLRVNASMISLSGENRPVILGVANDVTGLVKARQQISDLSERMQAVLENVENGITAAEVGNYDKELLFANNRFFELHGYSKEQYDKEVGVITDLVHPDDRQRIITVAAEMNEPGLAATLEHRVIRRDGQIRWIRANVSVRSLPDIQRPVQFVVYTDITEEKLAQDKLHAVNEQLQTMMDDMPGGFVRLRVLPDGDVATVYANDNIYRMHGVTRGDSLFADSLGAMNTIHPDDVELVRSTVREMVESGAPRSIRYRSRHADGSYIPFSVFGRMTSGHDGAKYLNVYYMELSEQEKKEQTVRETVPLVLSSILASSTGIAYAKDRESRYICASSEFMKVTGYTQASEIIGKTDHEIFPPEIADIMRSNDMKLLETGTPMLDYVQALPQADGSRHYYQLSKYVLQDTYGNMLGVYGIGRDITEEKGAFSRLKLLVDSIPGGIASYIASPEGIRISYFNEAFSNIFGYTHAEYEEISAANIASLTFAEDMPELMEQVQALIRDGKPIDYTYRAHTKDGGYKWVNMRGAVAERHGDICILNGVLYDVTERMEAENALRLSEEQFRIAAAIGDKTVARYDFNTSVYQHTSSYLLNKGFANRIENVPQSIIDAGVIAPECISDYLAFYDKLRRGESPCRVDIAVPGDNGRWRWLREEAHVITDGSGKPAQAIIVFSDITELREKETVFKKWQQSLQGKQEDAFMLFRCNLSRNSSFDSVEGRLFWLKQDPDLKTFNERTQEYSQQCVYEGDREEYIAFLNSDTLLANYYRGVHTKTLEYREALPDGNLRWLRLTVELVEYPNSTDVEAFLLYENIDIDKRDALLTKELARNDSLTGLLNRASFSQAVERLLSETGGSSLAILMMDIDAFKSVNDTLGHDMGDQVLRETADGLRSVVRRDDLLGRLGGDEFMVCLKGINNDEAVAKKAEQICTLLHKPLQRGVQLSVSVGIAIAPRDGQDFVTLYRKADTALYKVKATGKNSFAFYNSEMDAE